VRFRTPHAEDLDPKERSDYRIRLLPAFKGEPEEKRGFPRKETKECQANGFGDGR
jgi:hypothetical protein